MVENRASQITAVAVTFIALTWISTLLRCFVRIYVVKHFGSDDYFAVASLVRSILYELVHSANVKLGHLHGLSSVWYGSLDDGKKHTMT